MAAITADSYPIARPTGVCAHSGVTIEPGSPYVATLVERDGQEGLDRIDFSITAWENGARPARLFGFWRTVMSATDEKPRLFIDDNELLSLFEQLSESDDEKRIVFRFLLGLILMRKRLLRHAGTETRDGRRVMLARAKGSTPEDPLVEIIDPELDDKAIEEAADQLTLALRGES